MFDQSDRAPDNITDWVLRGGVGLIFVLFGLEKFPSDPNAHWVQFFNQVGAGQWFRYFNGVVEVIGGALVVLPATARFGLALLALTMAAASAIHIFVIHQPANVLITGTFCIGLTALWWKKRTN